MNLVINGENRSFEAEDVATVDELIDGLNIEAGRGVAVAVDDAVVPRSRWKETELCDGNRVEIIRATQGG